MRSSAFDPPAIPPAFWERPDVCQALRQRDMSALFRLLRQYLGLSQMRIGTAVGLGQGRMSEVINGIRKIRDVKVFERIADGLDMPDHARVLLGLTPRQITAPPPRSPSATSGQDVELLRQITAAGRIDATVVRVLQGETDNIRLLDRRLGAPAVAASWTRTSARLRPACGTLCAPGTASSSPVPWPTPPRWPDGRPST
jgi:transcriptional regulator with XRE-family HTH domain